MFEVQLRRGGSRNLFKKQQSPLNILAIRLTVIFVILLVVAGVFWLFEKDHIQDESGGDFSYLDSLYFTIVTVTTVGYGDIVPVTEEARMFDAFIITPIRILVWIMMIGTAYQLVMQNQWEDFKVNRILKKMKDHIIIVGYGSTGVATLKELRLYKFPENKLVVIDKMEPPLGTAADIGAIGVLGDASSEDTLLLAGIKRASIIIVTTPKDDSNVMITLTAKDLNSRVKIITRVSERENIKQLKRAGADVIISPSLTSGNLMAMAVANSNSVELIEDMLTTSRGVNVIQRKITQSEVGKSPKTLKGFITIGIVRKGKNIGPRELDGEVLKQGDDIIYIG
jgi:voltage-gated potassium channel